MAIATIQFGQWTRKYNTEREIKELYSDLMDARMKAMNRNVQYVVELTANQYTVCEDCDNDNVCDTAVTCDTNSDGAVDANEVRLTKSSLAYPLSWGLTGGTNRIRMDRKGIIITTGNIRIADSASANYDCVVLDDIRINMGKYDGAACQAR